MSDDLDFDMEVAEEDELGELGADGASGSEKRSYSELSKVEECENSKSELQNHGSSVASERGRRFGPFTLNVPEEWRAERQRKVKQLFTRGKQPTYADEGVPVINQECIYWNDWHFENLRFLDREEAKDWPEKYFPKKGDIILNSTGQGTLGRAQVYPDEERRAVDSHVTILRTTDDLNPYFHRYFLEGHLGQALLYSMCVNGSTGQIELSKTRLDLMPVPIPPLPEQRKIASVLYAVDQAIQKTEAIIEQAQRVKRGLMQDLFTHGLNDEETQRIRPGEFPKSWEIKTLGEVANVVRGNTPDTKNENYYGGANVWVTPNDLSNLYEDGVGKYIADSERKLTDSGVEAKSLSMVRPNSVMFTSRSYGIGKTAICTVPAATNQGITAFECESELREEFLYYYLNHTMDYIVSISGVATFPEITKRGVEGLPIPVPDPSTQEAITSPLSTLDDLIDHEIESKEELKQLKKGLVQDLLTGEVRTADKAIEVLDEVKAHG